MDPSLFGVAGDTVWVNDRGLGRMTLFTRLGEVLATASGTEFQVSIPDASLILRPYRMRPDGYLETSISSSYILGPPPPSPVLVPTLLVDLGGHIVDTLRVDTLSSSELFPQRDDRVRFEGLAVVPPWSDADGPLSFATLNAEVTVVRRRAGTGDPSVFTVTRISASGDTVHHLRFGYRPRPYAGAVLDSLVAERTRPYEDRVSDLEGFKAFLLAETQLPAFQSPVASAQLGADESVWLRREDERREQIWIVIDPAGVPRGRLRLPRGSAIQWSTAGEAWIVERDELDVEWLAHYTIRG
jgi:hypothetical protein